MIKRAGAVACLIILAGCSGGSSGRHVASTVTAPALTSSPSASPKPTPTAKYAAAVVAALKAKGLPIGSVIVYTAATDPNHLLGRPNGYDSKASFTDTRIKPSDSTQGNVDAGGSVEVFAAAADAQARKTYIQAAEKSAPIVGTEYDYVTGRVLLRVSSVLTPDQAQQYEAALAGIG